MITVSSVCSDGECSMLLLKFDAMRSPGSNCFFCASPGGLVCWSTAECPCILVEQACGYFSPQSLPQSFLQLPRASPRDFGTLLRAKQCNDFIYTSNVSSSYCCSQPGNQYSTSCQRSAQTLSFANNCSRFGGGTFSMLLWLLHVVQCTPLCF